MNFIFGLFRRSFICRSWTFIFHHFEHTTQQQYMCTQEQRESEEQDAQLDAAMSDYVFGFVLATHLGSKPVFTLIEIERLDELQRRYDSGAYGSNT